MTSSSRGAPNPQHQPCTRGGPPHSAALVNGDGRTRRRASPEPLERRLSNVTDVEEPGRLVECSQIGRQRQFQYLVRRYLSQILYGCTSTYCTTSTCLTCNKRLVSRPFRAPTQLTARAIAHYLASQDDPHRGLCPHPLNVSPTSLEIEGANGVDIRQTGSEARIACNVTPSEQQRFGVAYERDNVDTNPSEIAERGEADTLVDAVAARHQTKKDPKSLSQNLYDTVTMIYSYSKHIPNPRSVFDLLRTAIPERHSESETVPSSMVTQHDTDHHLKLSTSPSHANGHAVLPAVPPAVNGSHTPTETAPHHSQPSPRSRRTSNAKHVISEVLSNGQTIHRIKHLPDSAKNGHSPPLKTLDTPSLDGTLESTITQKRGMKSKALALDTYITSKTGPAVTTSTAINKQAFVETTKKEQRPTLPVASHLTCDILEQLKEEVYHHRNEQPSNTSFIVDYDTNRRFRPTKPFVNRSVFFALSDPDTLLKSFREDRNEAYNDSPLPHLNSNRLTHAFRDWNRRNGALIFDSLWIAVEALFRPPPELDTQKSPRLKPSRKDATSYTCPEPHSPPLRYLSNEEVAHIVMICIHALTSLIPVGWPHTWTQLRKFRSWGIVMPNAPPHKDFTDGFIDPWLNIIDELEYEPAIRLADRLLRGIGARLCFEHVLATLAHRNKYGGKSERWVESPFLAVLVKHLKEVERLAIAGKRRMKADLNFNEDPGWTVTATFTEWLRTIIIKKWDGKAEINKWSSVGTAMMIMEVFNRNKAPLNLRMQMFHIAYLNERLDTTREPIEFLSWENRPNSFHVFQHPFLFPPDYLVGYFRTINFTTMLEQFEHSERTKRLQERVDLYSWGPPYWWMYTQHLKVTLADYFVLDVSREDPLKDTLNQLWGSEKRELLKPLKVRMGMQEGEVGLDQGGVTYEFFQLVLTEAFKPDNGMFTVDPQTRMTWFQPASFEPLWKFEMLGILFSLAVYNGITLPVTFPLALYDFLGSTQYPCAPRELFTTDFIRDGWPTLAKSLDELLAWDKGDVADVFMRSFSFSFEAFGKNIDVDMQAVGGNSWPSTDEEIADWRAGRHYTHTELRRRHHDLNDPAWERPHGSAAETPMVTNANRKEFVQQYIMWLTVRSVSPQLEAFRTGFRACLQEKALSLFDAAALKALIEGTQSIDVAALKKATHYEEGYSAAHGTIKDFWSIVEQYSQDDRKRLLEFVTASERVPVTGFESMNFVIVRAGDDTEMLPTSSTCFGKLMLPEYATKEKLKRKLDLTIQNAKGFGVV